MFNRSTVVTALGWCRAWFGALVMGLNHTIKQARTRAVFVQAAAIAALLLFAQAAPAQQSTIEIYEFVFVKLSGRPGHQGYFPMQSAPAPGQPSTIRVTLFGPVLSARAELVRMKGAAIAAAAEVLMNSRRVSGCFIKCEC